MDVPWSLPTSTEKSRTSTSRPYNNRFLNINLRSKPSRPRSNKTHNFYNSFGVNLDDFRTGFRKDDDIFFRNIFLNDRLNELLNNTYRHHDLVWLPTPRTRDYSSLFESYNAPPFKQPKVYVSDVPATRSSTSPATTILWASSSVIFCILCALIKITYSKRVPRQERGVRGRSQRYTSNVSTANLGENNSQNGYVTLLVDSQTSLNDMNSDPPPSYSECAANDHGIVTKSLDVTCEDPPPYSTCLGLGNTDDVAKVHKPHSREDPQTHTDTDINLNNLQGVEENGHINDTSSRGAETTINIGDVEDRFAPNRS